MMKAESPGNPSQTESRRGATKDLRRNERIAKRKKRRRRKSLNRGTVGGGTRNRRVRRGEVWCR